MELKSIPSILSSQWPNIISGGLWKNLILSMVVWHMLLYLTVTLDGLFWPLGNSSEICRSLLVCVFIKHANMLYIYIFPTKDVADDIFQNALGVSRVWCDCDTLHQKTTSMSSLFTWAVLCANQIWWSTTELTAGLCCVDRRGNRFLLFPSLSLSPSLFLSSSFCFLFSFSPWGSGSLSCHIRSQMFRVRWWCRDRENSH